MIQINTLLGLRNKIKEKKPDFIRQDYQRRKRLGRKLKWRKPKGIHSKIRHHFKGRRKMPSPGYKSPFRVRGLHSSGLGIVNVTSLEDVKKIKKENEGIIVSKNVGMKKRLEILKKAKELDITIFNLSIDEQIKKIEDLIHSKKKGVKEIKKEQKEEKVTKEGSKEKFEELTDKQKKEADKKDKDKILTKRT